MRRKEQWSCYVCLCTLELLKLFRKIVWELKDNTFLGTGFCLNSWCVINLVKKVLDLLKENSQLAIEPCPNSVISWNNATPWFYTSQFVTYNSYLHLRCTTPDPFWYSVICSTFFAKCFHPMPSPRSGWHSSISCPRLCVQHTRGQLVIICKKLLVMAPCGHDKRQDCALRDSITYLIQFSSLGTVRTLIKFGLECGYRIKCQITLKSYIFQMLLPAQNSHNQEPGLRGRCSNRLTSRATEESWFDS
jgi:hypothetical protein